MKRDQLIKQIEKINEAGNTVEIYILAQPELSGEKLSVDFYKARLHQDIPQEVIDLFYPVIEKKIITKAYDVLDYDPALTPDREVIWEQKTEMVPFYNFFHQLVETSQDIDWYNNEVLPYEDIWAYWIKIYGKGNSFYIIKKVTSSKVIKTGGKLALIFDTDVFRRLVDDVLTMDGTFDAIYCNQSLIFENKQNFEKALLYQDVRQTKAIETLDEIDKKGLVDNFNRVKEFLKDDYYSVSKLTRLKGKPYFKNLTFSSCKQIIEDYGVDIDIDNTNKRFNIVSKQQAKLFIKVLNDDYLKSEMTDNKYAANSKEDL